MHWFFSENRLKVVMPSAMHECAGAWLSKMITRASRRKLLSNDWEDTMDIMTGPEYRNFIGQHAGSFKQPDMAFVPIVGPDWIQCAAFPSVLESGWNESIARREEDARLWQEGSGNAVRVVLQAKVHEPDYRNCIHLVLSVTRAYPDGLGRLALPTHYANIFPIPPDYQKDPTISLDEFYAENCSSTMNAKTEIPLNLSMLRNVAAKYIRDRGYLPA
ncbi:hypothetical protein B9Z19DRAFT_365395 [Tuber borchii]|uniref:Uncharacterized protein n=1 Tax=Tuber borchii TaxID=42251 RepID=A0A2T6ZI88_TUBBO|nr:hypothetical protein B9Z19DRAFT_365395 [Tuber borchii]